jgi:DNA polymerase-3 subunit delta
MPKKDSSLMTLKRQLKEHTLSNLYLFYGEEAFLKELYLTRIKAQIPDGGLPEFNHIKIESTQFTFDQINDFFESYPMMTEHKLIVLKNSGIFKSPKEEMKAFWTTRLSDIPEFVTVIFDEKEVDKRSSTYKALVKNGMAVEFEYLKETDLVTWVQREVKNAGKRIDKENAVYFVNICDPGIITLQNELDKLIHYCNTEIYRTDIDRVVSKSLQIRVFEITDSIMAKNTSHAMEVLADLKTIKESAFKILYLLSSTFDKMLQIKLLLADGATFQDAASKIGTSPFIARKYADSAKGFSVDFLMGRVIRIAEIDFAIKQGKVEDWLALEQYIAECANQS